MIPPTSLSLEDGQIMREEEDRRGQQRRSTCYSLALCTMMAVMFLVAILNHDAHQRSYFELNGDFGEEEEYRVMMFGHDEEEEETMQYHRRLAPLHQRPNNIPPGCETDMRTDYTLEFVHITKTGGSAIEQAAARHKIRWGACHYLYLPMLQCCSPDRQFKTVPPRNETKVVFPTSHLEPWHWPPSYQKHRPYGGANTFAVVRDPYDRCVSEFYCKWAGYKGDPQNMTNPALFNYWIQQKVLTLVKKESQQSPYVMDRTHFYPQHHYIFDDDGTQVVDHVIRYENLKDDFDALMEQYDLPVRLPDKKGDGINKARFQGPQKLTTQNLTRKSVELINAYYAKDFELLGYVMRMYGPIVKN